MDEIQRIVIQVENEAKLREYNAQLKAQKETLEQILNIQKQQGGTLSGAQYQQFQRTTAGAVQSTQGIQQASSALRSAGGNTQAMTQFGYALEDFMAVQGGWAQRLSAIANNMQMVAMSMGVGGTTFVAITGAIVGIKAFVQNYEAISGLIKGIDTAELKRRAEEIKKTGAEADALRGKPTPTEAAQAGRATEAMTAAGFRRVGGGIEASLFQGATPEALTKEEAAEVEAAFYVRGSVHDAAGLEKQMQMRRAIKTHKVIREGTDWLLAEAGKPGAQGQAALQRLADIAMKHPKFFPPGFTEDIDRARRGVEAPGTGADVGPSLEAWGGMDETNEQRIERMNMPPLPGGRLPAEAFQPRRAGMSPAEMRAGQNRGRERPIMPFTSPEALQMELSQIRTMQSLNAVDSQADQMVGGGPYLARQLEMERRANMILQWQSRQNGGQMFGGNFSASPPFSITQ